MDATRILAITAVIGIALTLLTLVGGGGYALAELRASMDRLEETVDRNHHELQHSLGITITTKPERPFSRFRRGRSDRGDDLADKELAL